MALPAMRLCQCTNASCNTFPPSFQETSGDPGRLYNTHVVLNSSGDIVARYRKIHLFDVEVRDGPILMESCSTKPGSEVSRLCYCSRYNAQACIAAMRQSYPALSEATCESCRADCALQNASRPPGPDDVLRLALSVAVGPTAGRVRRRDLDVPISLHSQDRCGVLAVRGMCSCLHASKVLNCCTGFALQAKHTGRCCSVRVPSRQVKHLLARVHDSVAYQASSLSDTASFALISESL